MNRRMVLQMLGKIILLEAALLVLPLFVSHIYHDGCGKYFLITIGIASVIGGCLALFSEPSKKLIYVRDGFLIVASAWICLSLLGALPFYLSGQIPSYIDAVFETVSGYTTTGSTILTDVEAMSRSLLFWRSFTHWIGGMGILVLIMAIIPGDSGRAMHIMRAEVPGPVVGKVVPRIRDTAKILYIMYGCLTAVEIIFLLAGGMSLFDSVVHAFGTAGTGGFGIKADGLASYSPYLQWVIGIFMMLFGINFNIYYLLITRKFRSVIKSGELWCYLSVIAVSTVLVSVNISGVFTSLPERVRQAFFQVSSIITTTGYSTCDFDLWPSFSKAILIMLMFIGGCAGSTAGGLKVSRIILLFKQARSELGQMTHPRSVRAVMSEGKRVEPETLRGVSNYLSLYLICLIVVFLAISIDGFDFETNATAAISCFNNIGPGLSRVGPLFSYADYSGFSKIMLSIAMLLGRLEIYPLLIAAASFTAKKKM